MKQRLITGAILIALFLPFVILGGIPYTALMTVAIGFGMFELLKATEGKIEKNDEKKRCLNWPKWLIILICLLTMIGSVYPYLISLVNGNGFIFSNMIIPIIPFVLLSFILFGGSVLSEKINIQDVFLVIAMSMFLMIGGQSLAMIRDMGGAFIIFVLLTCFITDSGAYFTGYICSKNFKTHKLNERISPKKSIEGAIGGAVCGLIIGTLFAILFPINHDVTSTFINIGWDPTFNIQYVLSVLLMTLVLTVVGQIGDLTFSMIKRHFQVKDFSNMLPGHGGFGDRIDSACFNVITVATLLSIFLIL
jgi:phosphatidate cytidylyltransferase